MIYGCSATCPTHLPGTNHPSHVLSNRKAADLRWWWRAELHWFSRAGSRNSVVDAALWSDLWIYLRCTVLTSMTCPPTMIYVQKQRTDIYWNIRQSTKKKYHSNSVPAPQTISKQSQSPQHNCPLGQTKSGAWDSSPASSHLRRAALRIVYGKGNPREPIIQVYPEKWRKMTQHPIFQASASRI